MSVPPLALTLGSLALSIISDGFAMSKPLVSLEGYYDLHLFPERDRFDYTVSETHKASQAMHVMAAIMLGLAFLMSLGNIFFVSMEGSRNTGATRFTVLSTTLVGLGTACYIVAMSTLLKVGLDYKRIADDMPLPTPNAYMEIGATMDIVGLVSSIMAFILVTIAVVRTERQGFLRLV